MIAILKEVNSHPAYTMYTNESFLPARCSTWIYNNINSIYNNNNMAEMAVFKMAGNLK